MLKYLISLLCFSAVVNACSDVSLDVPVELFWRNHRDNVPTFNDAEKLEISIPKRIGNWEIGYGVYVSGKMGIPVLSTTDEVRVDNLLFTIYGDKKTFSDGYLKLFLYWRNPNKPNAATGCLLEKQINLL